MEELAGFTEEARKLALDFDGWEPSRPLVVSNILVRLFGVATPVFIAITACGGFRQQTPPRFEVASVKPSANRNFIGMDAGAGGRLIANGPLTMLIANAYNVRQFQVLGGPAWIHSDLYRIEAKTEGRATRSEMLGALQALLEDRFKLKVERQTREPGVYVLTVRKSGVKRELVSAGKCPASDANVTSDPPQPGQRPCGVVGMMISSGRVRLEGRKATITQLFERLSNFVDRPTIDRTGYIGTLDVELEFAPDRNVLDLWTVLSYGRKRQPRARMLLRHLPLPSGRWGSSSSPAKARCPYHDSLCGKA